MIWGSNYITANTEMTMRKAKTIDMGWKNTDILYENHSCYKSQPRGCRIHRLYLCRKVRHLSLKSDLDMILNHLMVRLQFSSFGE